jgi:DNA-binding LacI/PurR family transcriptional regulator
MSITIKDVARKAEVSVATVSRVVNQKDIHKVGIKTQKRIEKILKELGYHPNTMARGLKTRKTRNIGVVFFWYDKPNLSDFYITRILDGVINFLADKQYNILMNTFTRSLENQGLYSSFLNSGLMDGILAISPPLDSQFFQDLKNGSLPNVLVNYQVNDPEVCFVDCLNTQGVIDAVDHLIALEHKHIGFIAGDVTFSKNSLDRLNAFKFILKKRHLTYHDEHIYFGNYQEESGAKAVQAMWKTKTPPTALLASSDAMAVGAVKQLRRMGLRVPQDVAVIGFDDLPVLSMADVALTTVHQPLYDMGFEAAKMLWHRIENRPVDYKHRFFPTKLVIRESCGFYLKHPNVTPENHD